MYDKIIIYNIAVIKNNIKIYTMKKFRTKEVFVEAEKWLGKKEQKESLLAEGIIMDIPSRDGSCLVPTMGGNLTCHIGDYIVKDSDGQYSVCNAETFKATYEVDAKKSVEKVVAKTTEDVK